MTFLKIKFLSFSFNPENAKDTQSSADQQNDRSVDALIKKTKDDPSHLWTTTELYETYIHLS